jgi:hypothetical protein
MSFKSVYLNKGGSQKTNLSGCSLNARKAAIILFSHVLEIGAKALSQLRLVMIFTALLLFFLIPATYPMDITLRWNPNTDADLAGYRLYYKAGSTVSAYNGTGALEGDSPIEIGKETELRLHGLRDDEVYFFAVTAYDFESLESNYSNVVDALSVTLHQGSNLISLYRQPDDVDISSVLSSISGKYVSVWAFIQNSWRVYDPANPGFSDLTAMESGRGYWIEMSEPATLLTYGSTSSNSINLLNGSNLVGYNSASPHAISSALDSIDGKYVSVWTFVDASWKVYDPANAGFSDLTTMEPGCGYWIDAAETCTWTVP